MTTTTAEPQPVSRVSTAADSIKAIAELPRDLAIIKMEQDTIMSLAAATPRDYTAIFENLKGQLKAFPTFAKAAIYAKPVGKDEHGHAKVARGLSIRMAEALAEAYGFNKVRSSVTPIGNDKARVDATFTDYQRGRIWEDSGVVTQTYKTRNGSMARHPDDRFYNVVLKAEASRRIREVILRSVPPGLRSELTHEIDKLLDEYLDKSTVEKLVASFSQKNVTKEMIEGLLGKPIDALIKEDRATLLGVWNSIENEEATIEEVFGQATAGAAPAPEGSRTEQVTEKLKGASRSKPEQASEPEVAEATITTVQFGTLRRLYRSLSNELREAFHKQMETGLITEYAKLPVSQYEDVKKVLGDMVETP